MVQLPLEPQKYISLLGGEKIRLVFMFQVPSAWASWESFYYACIDDARFAVRFVLIEKTATETSQMLGARGFLENNQIQYVNFEAFDLESFKPHVIFYQFPYDTSHRAVDSWFLRFKRMGFRIAYIPYGIEIADTDFVRHLHFDLQFIQNCWRIYTISNSIKNEYNQYCNNKSAVRALGIPKLDALYFKDRFKLDNHMLTAAEGRRIVLLKVHFPALLSKNGLTVQTTPYLDEYISFIDTASKYKDLFFIFRPHPKFSDSTIDERNRAKAKQIIEMCGELDNFYVDSGCDYRNSLLNSDAIIIDRSALMVEAVANGCPVLYMSNPDFYEPMTKPVAELISSYYQGTVASDMLNFVEMLRRGEDEKKPLRETAKEKFFEFFDGKCGERIKDNIAKSLVEESKNPNKKLNIVFFSFGNVCKYFLQSMNLMNDERYNLLVIADNDPAKHGMVWNGVSVVSPESLRELDFDYVIITSDAFYMDISRQLVGELYITPNKILHIEEFALDVLRCL